MIAKIRNSYEHTIYACYIGYITQAIVNNFAPLLFLTFMSEFEVGLEEITLVTTVNFLVQLLVDLLATKFVDVIGYRPSVVFGHICATIGLSGMAWLPTVMENSYAGLMIAVIFYAIGGGINEVLVSPIVEACPTEKKEAAMSLLHSFFCWGQVFMVAMSTLFFQVFGIENWRVLACIWALVPFFNTFYFSQVPIYSIVDESERMPLRTLLKQKMFWIIVILMFCAGSSELAMAQWASAFAEKALGVSKAVGDLAGPCAFAVCMGIARTIYGKFSETIPLQKFMVGSAFLCIFSYAIAVFTNVAFFGLLGCALCGFSVGIFWPGTFSIAAIRLPGGGTAMYALLALAGDVGCSAGPTAVGMLANSAGGNLRIGLTIAMVFPIIILIGIALLREKKMSAV